MPCISWLICWCLQGPRAVIPCLYLSFLFVFKCWPLSTPLLIFCFPVNSKIDLNCKLEVDLLLFLALQEEAWAYFDCSLPFLFTFLERGPKEGLCNLHLFFPLQLRLSTVLICVIMGRFFGPVSRAWFGSSVLSKSGIWTQDRAGLPGVTGSTPGTPHPDAGISCSSSSSQKACPPKVLWFWAADFVYWENFPGWKLVGRSWVRRGVSELLWASRHENPKTLGTTRKLAPRPHRFSLLDHSPDTG